MQHKFFDLQVNGYAGLDFNREDYNEEHIQRACELMIEHGAEGALATVITDDLDAMTRKLEKIAALIRPPITGIHIEGPFISSEPGYIGAHPAQHAIPANLDAMKRLLDAAAGLTRMVTLAPEQDPGGHVTSYLNDSGVTVSAGHCDPTMEQLEQSIDAGLSMFTHLGNGCPAQMHRHDNIIQRVLSISKQLMVCYIADGAHIPFSALKNYLTVSGIDRSIVVTDAISATGLGPGTYTLGEREVAVGEDGVVWAPDRSHFVGSACPMPRVIENLREHLALDNDAIASLVFHNPKIALSG